jgi:hypothetical protein
MSSALHFIPPVTPYQDLLQTFSDAVEAFNQIPPDLKQLAALFDDDVTLKKIGTPPYTYDGRTDVLNYLNTDVTRDQPNFEPIHPLEVFFHGNKAQIGGYANWTDHEQGQEKKSKILYNFMFIRRRNRWLVLSLWAAPD